MRSHVTKESKKIIDRDERFQYRKRYEITCDDHDQNAVNREREWFQYRKRYEITCDHADVGEKVRVYPVSIPQAV